MKVRDVAHSRTGDKGDYSIISVICNDAKDYDLVKERLTVDKVQDAYSELCKGTITRYELPNIAAFIFELEHALGGGVTRTLAIDPHGKSMCGVMLEITL